MTKEPQDLLVCSRLNKENSLHMCISHNVSVKFIDTKCNLQICVLEHDFFYCTFENSENCLFSKNTVSVFSNSIWGNYHKKSN